MERFLIIDIPVGKDVEESLKKKILDYVKNRT